MFGSFLKAVVGTVIEAPLSIVADVVTLGGTLTDKRKPYTAEAVEKVFKNLKDSTDPRK